MDYSMYKQEPKDIDGSKIFTYNYSDFVEIVKNGKQMYESDKNHDRTGSMRTIIGTKEFKEDENYQKGWWGSDTFEEAIKFAEYGQDNLTAKVCKDINLKGTKMTIIPKYDVCGESIEIGKYLSGEPECMVEWDNSECMGKNISLYVLRVNNGFVSSNEIEDYGTRVLGIIDNLENNGYSIELHVLFKNNLPSGDKLIIDILVKKCGEFLNPNIIAYTVAGTAFYRRLKFKFIEMSEYANNSIDPYGSAIELSSTEIKEIVKDGYLLPSIEKKKDLDIFLRKFYDRNSITA